jgi:hypothetical protein
MNESPFSGTGETRLDAGLWVQFAEAVIQRATRRGAPPPSET